MKPMRVLIGCECSGVVRRKIPGFPDYFATSEGEIISYRGAAPIIMRRRPHRSGYNLVSLRADGGKVLNTTLHRAIAMAFHPNEHRLPCVRHLDGNKSNCRPENLAWGTYSDNEADKVSTGTRRYGTSRMKLNKGARSEILQSLSEGVSRRALAERFGVSRSTITRLANGSTWTNRKWPMAEKAAER